MIADRKLYPSMKDSGVPWLGQVPAHWEVKRGKNLFQCIDFRSVTGDEELLTVSSEYGVVPRRSATVTMFKAESYVGHKLCWPGDLVINSLWAWARGLGVSKFYGIVSTAYGVYRPRAGVDIDSRFIHELVRSTPFHWELQVRSKGVWTSRLQLTDESFLGAPFICPTLDEQSAIARFLDHADRRIRRVIRAKLKLVKLLEEQKQAIIYQAVTCGLDPTVRLKPSGVEWLGDVPEHWEVRRLKQLFREVDNRSESGTEVLLSLRMYRGLVPHNDVSQTPISSNALVGFKRIQPGQLVMNRMRAAIGMFGVASQPGLVSPDYAVFAPRPLVDVSYFLHLFKTRALGTRFRVESKGLGTGSSGFMRLYTDRFGIIKVPVPPCAEQEQIVSGIVKLTAEITTTAKRVEIEISLLREYRTCLIADVVTGKLDVRAAAANLPDETDEPEAADDTDALAEGDETAHSDLDAAPEEAEA